MTRVIDLNADMGEYADRDQQQLEAALMPLISSCSIACGGHAGDTETMLSTLRLANSYNVSIGAHPSYPDKDHFGRRNMAIDAASLCESLKRQISDLLNISATEQLTLKHIKPHGALYNDAARNPALAEAIISAALETAPGAAIFGPAGSEIDRAAGESKLAFIPEGFVDRRYRVDGSLTPRSEAGAVITDIDARAEQALAIARKELLKLDDGTVSVRAETLCIHSDSPGAVETASTVRNKLEANGFIIRSAR